MNITRITAAMPAKSEAFEQSKQLKEKQPTGLENSTLSQKDSNASKVIANYFYASQAVNPAFTGHSCATSNFRVKELPDMPCTCCGRPMMTNAQIDEFCKKASSTGGAELKGVLNDYMAYFRAEEKAIVHHITKNLDNHPDASMSVVIQRTSPDAATLLKEEQIDVLKRTSEKAKEILGEDNMVQNTVDRALSQFDAKGRKTNRGSSEFNRTGFLSNLVDLEQKGINHEQMHEILDVAVQLPESESIINKMLTKYGRGSDDELARRLVSKAVVTAEHIQPKSKGGPNHTANYMGECQECNGSRGNMSYDEWMQKYPNMPDNIQEHIEAVTEEIIKGKIGGNYDDYPVDLKEAIIKETDNKVVLKVKNPEEIDKMREERGLPKMQKDLKELEGAAGSYQGTYHGPEGQQKTQTTSKRPQQKPNNEASGDIEETRRPNKPNKGGKSGKGGKKGGKRHIDENMTIVRYMPQTKTEVKPK